MDPDRTAEERRRGLTIDLGFVWTTLPDGQRFAFVDVPGHERFVSTMLAGVGPVPGVLMVVAADQGWSAQTAEHLALLDALGVAHGLVVVTRIDLADPSAVLSDVPDWLAGTSLAGIPAVACSAITGDGLDGVRGALSDLGTRLPEPDRQMPSRLWLDRVFTIRGAGTVATGTLAAGRLSAGQEVVVARTGQAVTIRRLQIMHEEVDSVGAVSRVAVNLRGIAADQIGRGDALLTPGNWARTKQLDLLLKSPVKLATAMTLHIGSAAIPVRTRSLGELGVRVSLPDPIAVAYGDRVLLRDPGGSRVAGADVVDPMPRPLLRRRGAAAARGVELTEMGSGPDPDAELRRRGIEHADVFASLGHGRPGVEPIDGWLLDPAAGESLSRQLAGLATDHARDNPRHAGLTAGAVARALGLPDIRLLPALLRPPWQFVEGRLTSADRPRTASSPLVEAGITKLRERLQSNPFDAATAPELLDLGLDQTALVAAVRAGLLIGVGDGVFFNEQVREVAVARLALLDQPFSTSQARTILQTSRRVALALLRWLDAAGLTRRLPDDRRELSAAVLSLRPGTGRD